LQTVRQREGIYYQCPQCEGRAVTLQQIRRTTGDRYVSGLVRQVNTAQNLSTRPCPFCQASMKTFVLPNPPIMLESCRTCGMIWFDAGKFEKLPEGVVETTDDILIRGIEAEAKWKIEQERQRYQGVGGDPPDEWWKWIPALLGMPIKYESVEGAGWPWMTWSLSAIISIVSICAFFDLRNAVETWGMIPAHAWRYGGLTILTSFFLHGGIWHLVSNLYFFLLFGGEVEAFLGRWRFLAVIFASTVIGNLLHMIFNAHSQIPLIGASGGISGVLVFYALQFPHARLAFLFRIWFRFVWIHIPAWVAFIIWLLLQILGAYLQVAGFSDVASFAHLGGVLTGFVFWLVWRKLGKEKTQAQWGSGSY
jgi:membrane associated rhomboid family serine protease